MFSSQVVKNELMTKQWSKIVELLTWKQYLMVDRYGSNKFQDLAVSAMKVSLKQSVHTEANELLKLVSTPVMERN